MVLRRSESLIIVNAHKNKQGQMPSLRPSPGKLDGFNFIEHQEPEDALITILELVAKRIPNRFNIDSVEDIQVLTPMHRGNAGAVSLDIELQKTLNLRADGLVRGGKNFLVGDKVMQIRN